jgi:hypothetical protein
MNLFWIDMPSDFLLFAIIAVFSIGGGLYLLRQARIISAGTEQQNKAK